MICFLEELFSAQITVLFSFASGSLYFFAKIPACFVSYLFFNNANKSFVHKVSHDKIFMFHCYYQAEKQHDTETHDAALTLVNTS